MDRLSGYFIYKLWCDIDLCPTITKDKESNRNGERTFIRTGVGQKAKVTAPGLLSTGVLRS